MQNDNNNYIKKHYKKLLNKNIEYLSILLNLNIHIINQYHDIIFFKKNINTVNAKFLKINKMNYLVTNLENDRLSKPVENITFFINTYISKINREKSILKNLIKVKKNYKNIWESIFISDSSNILSRRLFRFSKTIYGKHFTIKYKNTYYIIKKPKINIYNNSDKAYLIIKNNINKNVQ